MRQKKDAPTQATLAPSLLPSPTETATEDEALQAAEVAGCLSDPRDWSPGVVVDGRYEVLEVIGHGGMGKVYRAHDMIWDIDIAIKSLLLSHTPARTLRRFLREAQVWIDLGAHPNVAQCWFARELDGLRLFLEYMPGSSLDRWIRSTSFDLLTVLDLFIQACDGLAYAHERGIVHRDIKPSNFLLDAAGKRLCLTDFGIVSHPGGRMAPQGVLDDVVLTRPGLGTPAYCAPEQACGTEVDHRADLYSLGISLFETLAGRRPFDIDSRAPASRLIEHHLETPAPDIRQFRPGVPAALAEVISTCLKKQPAERFASATALRAALITVREARGNYIHVIPYRIQERAAIINNRLATFHDLGLQEEARRGFSRAVEEYSTHPEILFNATVLTWRAGEIDDLEALRRLESNLGHFETRRWLAEIHLERHDCAAAAVELRHQLSSEPHINISALWVRLGDTCQTLGDETGMHHAYAEALARAADADRFVAWMQRPREQLLDIRSVKNFTGGRAEGIVRIVVAPDQEIVVTGHQNTLYGNPAYGMGMNSSEPILHRWNLATGQYLGALGDGGYRRVEDLELSIDGRYLWAKIATEEFHNLRSHQEYYDIVQGHRIDSVPPGVQMRVPNQPAPGRNDERIVSVLYGEHMLTINSTDNAVRLIDARNNRCVRTFGDPRSPPHRDLVTHMTPDSFFVCGAPVGDNVHVIVARPESLECWQIPATPPGRTLAWARPAGFTDLTKQQDLVTDLLRDIDDGGDTAVRALRHLRGSPGLAKDGLLQDAQSRLYLTREPSQFVGTWIRRQIVHAPFIDRALGIAYTRDEKGKIVENRGIDLRSGNEIARFSLGTHLRAARYGLAVGYGYTNASSAQTMQSIAIRDVRRDETWFLNLDAPVLDVGIIDPEHLLVLVRIDYRSSEARVVEYRTGTILYVHEGVSGFRIEDAGPQFLLISATNTNCLYRRTGPFEARLGQDLPLQSISPKGSFGIKMGPAGRLQAVDLVDGSPPRILERPRFTSGQKRVGNLAWSPCERFLFRGHEYEGYIDVFDVHSGEHVSELGYEGAGCNPTITDSGDLLAIVRRYDRIEVRELVWGF